MQKLEGIITADNVQELGERIAIVAVRTRARIANGALDSLYKRLLYDVYRRNTPNHIFSDGYDLAQMAMCFLWEYKGHRLDEFHSKNRKGKEYNILYACFHHLDRYLSQYIKKVYTNDSLEEKTKTVEQIPYRSIEVDYTKYDEIVSKMNLKQGEQETLDCYMSGMTYCDIARFLGGDFSTIWRRKQRLQKKYLQAIY